MVSETTKKIFVSQLDTRRIIVESGCWLWIGAKNHFGYGCVTIEGHTYAVHRLF